MKQQNSVRVCCYSLHLWQRSLVKQHWEQQNVGRLLSDRSLIDIELFLWEVIRFLHTNSAFSRESAWRCLRQGEMGFKGVFTCENSHRCEFDTGMTLWFHTVFTWRDTSCHIEDCACASRSRLPGKWFHAGANARTAFTWHRNVFSYRNENLAPVQLPGWTRTGMSRSGMRFCADIM